MTTSAWYSWWNVIIRLSKALENDSVPPSCLGVFFFTNDLKVHYLLQGLPMLKKIRLPAPLQTFGWAPFGTMNTSHSAMTHTKNTYNYIIMCVSATCVHNNEHVITHNVCEWVYQLLAVLLQFGSKAETSIKTNNLRNDRVTSNTTI